MYVCAILFNFSLYRKILFTSNFHWISVIGFFFHGIVLYRTVVSLLILSLFISQFSTSTWRIYFSFLVWNGLLLLLLLDFRLLFHQCVMPCNAEVSWFSLTIIWIERGKNKQFTIIFFLSSLLMLLLNCYSIIIVVVRLLLILENCKTFGKMRIVQELNRARAWNVTQTQIRTLRCTNSDTPHTMTHSSRAQQSTTIYMYTHMKYSTRLTTHGAKKEEENVEKKRENRIDHKKFT